MTGPLSGLFPGLLRSRPVQRGLLWLDEEYGDSDLPDYNPSVRRPAPPPPTPPRTPLNDPRQALGHDRATTTLQAALAEAAGEPSPLGQMRARDYALTTRDAMAGDPASARRLVAEEVARKANQQAEVARRESLIGPKLTRETLKEGAAKFDSVIDRTPDPTEKARLTARKMNYLAGGHRQLELGRFGRATLNSFLVGSINAPIRRQLREAAESGQAVGPEELLEEGLTNAAGKPVATERGFDPAVDFGAEALGTLPSMALGIGMGRLAARGLAGSARLAQGGQLAEMLRAYAAAEPTASTLAGRVGQRALLEAPQGALTGIGYDVVRARAEGEPVAPYVAANLGAGLVLGGAFGAASQGVGEGLVAMARRGPMSARLAEGLLLRGYNPLAPERWVERQLDLQSRAAPGASTFLPTEGRTLPVEPSARRGTPEGAPAAVEGVAAPQRSPVGQGTWGADAGTQIKAGLKGLWPLLRERLNRTTTEVGEGRIEADPEDITPFRQANGYEREGPPTKAEQKRYGEVVRELARRASRAAGRTVSPLEVKGLLADEARRTSRGAAAGAVAGALAAPSDLAAEEGEGTTSRFAERLGLITGGAAAGAGVMRLRANRELRVDALTGAQNQRAWLRDQPKWEGDPKTSIVVFDANNFGLVNKGPLGMEGGNTVLKEYVAAVAQAADEVGIARDRVYRVGGDEVVVAAPNELAERVKVRAEEIFGSRMYGDLEVSTTAGIGPDFRTADDALRPLKQERKRRGADKPGAEGYIARSEEPGRRRERGPEERRAPEGQAEAERDQHLRSLRDNAGGALALAASSALAADEDTEVLGAAGLIASVRVTGKVKGKKVDLSATGPLHAVALHDLHQRLGLKEYETLTNLADDGFGTYYPDSDLTPRQREEYLRRGGFLVEEGFVDENGKWYSRSKALEYARKLGRLGGTPKAKDRVKRSGRLTSEALSQEVQRAYNDEPETLAEKLMKNARKRGIDRGTLGAFGLALLGSQSDDERVQGAAGLLAAGGLAGRPEFRPGDILQGGFENAKTAGSYVAHLKRTEPDGPPLKVRPESDGTYSVVVRGESVKAPRKEPAPPAIREADEAAASRELKEFAADVVEQEGGEKTWHEWMVWLDEKSAGLGSDLLLDIVGDREAAPNVTYGSVSAERIAKRIRESDIMPKSRPSVASGTSGFHSRLEQYLLNLPPQKATGEQWLRHLKRGESIGIPYEEVEVSLERELTRRAKETLSADDVYLLWEEGAKREGFDPRTDLFTSLYRDRPDATSDDPWAGIPPRDVQAIEEAIANDISDLTLPWREKEMELATTMQERWGAVVDEMRARGLPEKLDLDGFGFNEFLRQAKMVVRHWESPEANSAHIAVMAHDRYGAEVADVLKLLLDDQRSSMLDPLQKYIEAKDAHNLHFANKPEPDRFGELTKKHLDAWRAANTPPSTDPRARGEGSGHFGGYQRTDESALYSEDLVRSVRFGPVAPANKQYRKGHFSGDAGKPGTIAWVRTEDVELTGTQARRVIEAQSSWGPSVRDEGGYRDVELSPEERAELTAEVERLRASFEEIKAEEEALRRRRSTVTDATALRWRTEDRTAVLWSQARDRLYRLGESRVETRIEDDARDVVYLERRIAELEAGYGPEQSESMRVHIGHLTSDLRRRLQKAQGRLRALRDKDAIARARKRAEVAEEQLRRAVVRLDERNRRLRMMDLRLNTLIGDAVNERNQRGLLLGEAEDRLNGIHDRKHPWMPWYRTERHIGLALAQALKRAVEEERQALYIVSPENRMARASLSASAAEHIYGIVAPKWLQRMVDHLGLPVEVEKIRDVAYGGTGHRIALTPAVRRIIAKTGVPALGLLLMMQSTEEEDAGMMRAMAGIALVGAGGGPLKKGDLLGKSFASAAEAGQFLRELSAAGWKGRPERVGDAFDIRITGEVKPTEPGVAVEVRSKMDVEPIDRNLPLERQRPSPGSPGRVLQPDPQGRFISRLGQALEKLPPGKGRTPEEWLRRLAQSSEFSKKEFDAVLRPWLEEQAADAAGDPSASLLPRQLLDAAKQNEFRIKTVRLDESGAPPPPPRRATGADVEHPEDQYGFGVHSYYYENPERHPDFEAAVEEAGRDADRAERSLDRFMDSIERDYDFLSGGGARQLRDKIYEGFGDEKSIAQITDDANDVISDYLPRMFERANEAGGWEALAKAAESDYPVLPEGYTVKKTRNVEEWTILDAEGEPLGVGASREAAFEDAIRGWLETYEGDRLRSEYEDSLFSNVGSVTAYIERALGYYEEWREADSNKWTLENDIGEEEIRASYVPEEYRDEPDPEEYGLVRREDGALYADEDAARRAFITLDRPAGQMVYRADHSYVPREEAARLAREAEIGDALVDGQTLVASGAEAGEAEGASIVRYQPREQASGVPKWSSYGGQGLQNYREILTTYAHNPLDDSKYTAGHYYTSPADVHHMARMGTRPAEHILRALKTADESVMSKGEELGIRSDEEVLWLTEGQGDPANDGGETWQNRDPDEPRYTADPLLAGTPVKGFRRKSGGTFVITRERLTKARAEVEKAEREIEEIKGEFNDITTRHGTDPAVLAALPEAQALNQRFREAMAREGYNRHLAENYAEGDVAQAYENAEGITGTFIDSQSEVGRMNAARLLTEAAEGGHRLIGWISSDIGVARYSEEYRGLYKLVYDEATTKHMRAMLQALGYREGEDFTIARIPKEEPTADDADGGGWRHVRGGVDPNGVRGGFFVKLPEGFDARVLKRGIPLMGITSLLVAGDAEAQQDFADTGAAPLGLKVAGGAAVAGAVAGAWFLGRRLRGRIKGIHRPPLPGQKTTTSTAKAILTGRPKVEGRGARGQIPRLTENAIERLGLTPDLAKEMAKKIHDETAARGGKRPPVPWAVTRQLAAEALNVKGEALADMDPRRVTGDEVLALASLASERAKKAADVTEKLKDPSLTVEARETLQEEMDALDRDFVTFMAGAMRGASEQGRALNAAKILANVHADPDAWVYRAQRLLGPRQTLSVTEAAEVRKLAQAGDTEALLKYLAKLKRSSIPEQIVTVLNAGLFTRPAARALDAIGGVGALLGAHGLLGYPKAVLDYLIGKTLLSGARSATAPSLWRWKNIRYGAGEGWRETKRFIGVEAAKEGGFKAWVQHIRSADVTPEMLARYDIPNLTTIDMLSLARDPETPANKAVDLVQKAIYRSLSVSDRVIVGAGYEGFLSDLALAMAKNEGAKDVKLRAQELYDNPPDELRAQALYLAHELTFQNEGLMSGASRAVMKAPGSVARRLSGIAGVGERGAETIDAAMRYQFPVVRTAANIAARVGDYTPLGGFRGTVNLVKAVLAQRAGDDATRLASQRKAVDALTRFGAGMGLLAIGAYLAEEGLATGAAPVDAAEREKWRAEGKRSNSILVDGEWRPLGRLAPGGTVIAMGATLHDLKEHGRGVSAGSAAALGRTILDQPLLTGSRTALDALRDPVGMGERYTEGLAGRAVPTIVGMTTAGATGNQYRDPAGPVEAVQARLDPEGALGLWERIPAQRDFLGEPIRGTQGTARALFNPFAGPRDRRLDDPLIARLDEIGFEPTGNRKAKEETTRQFEQRMMGQGAEVRRALEATMRSPNFARAREIAERMLERNFRAAERLGTMYDKPYQTVDDVERLVQIDMLAQAERNARRIGKSRFAEQLLDGAR